MHIHDLFEQLEQICQTLNQLDKTFADVYQQFDGNDFSEQNQLATILENEILGATHETASNIGFGLMDLKKLVNFIEFRKQFAQFTNHELLQIIDNPDFSAKDKLALLKKLNINHQTLLTLLHKIRQTWTNNFDKSYHQISNHFYAKY